MMRSPKPEYEGMHGPTHITANGVAVYQPYGDRRPIWIVDCLCGYHIEEPSLEQLVDAAMNHVLSETLKETTP